MANEHDGNIKVNCDQNTSTNVNNNEACKSEKRSNEEEEYNHTANLSQSELFSKPSNANSKITTIPNDIPNKTEYKQMSQHQRREENPFSFKHFLNRDTHSSSNSTNISATIVSTSSNMQNSNLASSNTTGYQLSNSKNNSYSSVFNLSPGGSSNNGTTLGSHTCNNQTNNNGNISNIISADDELPMMDQNQISFNSSNSVFGSNCSNPYQTSTGARPKVPQSISTSSSIGNASANENSKMKRSPRFSSFDSQASLAECAAGSSNDSTLYNNVSGGLIRDGNGIIDEQGKKNGSLFITNSEYDKQFIPRSYSNYDIDIAPTANNRCSNSSTPARANETSCSPLRNRNSPAIRPNRLIGIASQSSSNQPKGKPYSSSNSTSNVSGIRSNSEFAASALPDFVQDHWMDQWYYNDMHLNSPPNSPNQSPIDFVEDLPSCIVGGEKCQTLPDFLSDGPIIHSSGRLADVAAGLPDLDSPEDNSPGLQLSRIRLENDRLRRELDESRISLSEQIRRSNELERRLEQSRNIETVSNKNLNQSIEKSDENPEQKLNASESQAAKLKQQIKQLTAEVEVLRKENEILKETGAVGGDLINNKKPSKNQQLSRDLMRAAANAESNLRQLLSGVDNLRLMARSLICDNVDESGDGSEFNRQSPSINRSTTGNINNSASINLVNDEYLSDCDDFEDFSGPAL